MSISKILSILFLLSIFSFAQTTAPTNLKLTVGGPSMGGQSVSLSWDYSHDSMNVKFNIYKKPGLSTDTSIQFTKIAWTYRNNFIDQNVHQGDSFSYYVTAFTGAVESDPSNIVDGALNPPPPPVTAFGKINGNLFADVSLAPIPMGTVEIFPATQTFADHGVDVRTDSLGNFSVKLPVGDYYIWSSARNFVPEYFDNVATLKLATKISLKENDSLVFSIGLAAIAPPPVVGEGKISGNLFDDATTLGIPRGNVQIFPVKMQTNCGPGINLFTDSLGNFFGKIKAGDYYLYSSAHGYFGEYFDNANSIQSATKITVNAGDSLVYSIGLAKLVPPVTYAVSGSVKDAAGNPQKAELTAFIVNRQHTPSCWEMNYRTRTDSLGNYTFNHVRPNDTLVVYVEPFNRGLLKQYYNGKTTFADADRIPVAGNVTDINVTLVAKPVYANGISGVVLDSAGVTPVSGHVFIYQKQKGYLGFRGMVNTDTLAGTYSFTNLEPGQYYLMADGAGYEPSYFKYDGTNTRNWKIADSIVVTETSLVDGINFHLLAHVPLPGGAFVLGIVKGSNGSTLAGALNYVIDANNKFVDYAVSNMDGSYMISNLGTGTYTLVSTLVNFDNNQSSVSVDYLNNSTLNVDVKLTPNGTTGITDNSAVINGYALNQNYPNPFNPSTIISYQIQKSGQVSLKLYNILGKEVATLVNENQTAGKYNYTLNAGNLASGVYFYKIQSGSFISIKKLTLLK